MLEVSTALLDISYKLNDSDSTFDEDTTINDLIDNYLNADYAREMFDDIRKAIIIKGKVDTDKVITLDMVKTNLKFVYDKLLQEINNVENQSSYMDI